MSEITISKAKREEAAKVLYFIKELARYERMRKYVKATVEDIEKNIFDDKRANVIFVRRDGGATAYNTTSYSVVEVVLYMAISMLLYMNRREHLHDRHTVALSVDYGWEIVGRYDE
jgi:hypothetical protein